MYLTNFPLQRDPPTCSEPSLWPEEAILWTGALNARYVLSYFAIRLVPISVLVFCLSILTYTDFIARGLLPALMTSGLVATGSLLIFALPIYYWLMASTSVAIVTSDRVIQYNMRTGSSRYVCYADVDGYRVKNRLDRMVATVAIKAGKEKGTEGGTLDRIFLVVGVSAHQTFCQVIEAVIQKRRDQRPPG